MIICIVIPSVEYLGQAGVRIRYRRMERHLAALGHTIALTVIDDFTARTKLDADVYLFSKCYDARAILLAHHVRAAGAHVGADFFDDMFSQAGDARFLRQRAWLRDMAAAIDFALYSTPRMRAVVADFAPDAPAHILNDPVDRLDTARIAHRVAQKREEALATRVLRVAWFGIGDNPSFDVGLADLAAFGGELRRIERLGFAVDLQILTNLRALNEEGLRLLGRLAVPHRIEEWTEAREADLLDRSLVSFLPVNAQNFSIAKSLNRAVSALAGGTQILSAGYPLYDPLAAFLYRDPAVLVADLTADTLRLDGRTVPALGETLASWGDPRVEAERLAAFLLALPVRTAAPAPPLMLLHGARSPATTHKYTQRLGHLSVGSTITFVRLNYDVQILPEGEDVIAIPLSAKAVRHIAPAFVASLEAPHGDPPRQTLRLRVPAGVHARLRLPPAAGLAETIVRYEAAMADVATIVDAVLPGGALILSETSPSLDVAFASRAGTDAAAAYVVVTGPVPEAAIPADADGR